MNKWLIGKIMFLLVATAPISLAANDTAIGISSSGNGIAAWINYNTLDVNVAYFNSTTHTWSSSTAFGTSYMPPALSVASSGNAALVWIDENNIVRATYYTALTNNWSPIQALSSSGNYAFSIIVNIGNDVNNTAIIIWEEAGTSTPVVRTSYATGLGGGVWSSSTILS